MLIIFNNLEGKGKMIDVIYLNGGSGKRIDLGYPKQYARLKGKPIMIYGLEIFNQLKEIGNIIIPTAESEKIKTSDYLSQYNISKYIICNGGKTRQESVYKGLKEVQTDSVLIAESVRPFINIDFVSRIIHSEYKVVIPRNITKSTLVSSLSHATFNRKTVAEVQTPQKFDTRLLKEAHEKCKHSLNQYTDDMALFYAAFEDTFEYPLTVTYDIFEGLEQNVKITTKLDLYIAEAIYEYINR
jgi:D-ribitol-5-phosphate cytidylyltransferase